MAQGLSKGCAGLLVFPCVCSCFSTCVDISQHWYSYKPESQNGQSSGKKTSELTSKHDPSFAPMARAYSPRSWCKETPGLQSSRKRRWMERKSGKCTGSKHILIHTAKERISEDVVGIVVFASVSSRSMDRDPIWTPCDRSGYGTCQIWPRHLAKLHRPGKTWKTPYRNYTRDLGTQNCWGNANREV